MEYLKLLEKKFNNRESIGFFIGFGVIVCVIIVIFLPEAPKKQQAAKLMAIKGTDKTSAFKNILMSDDIGNLDTASFNDLPFDITTSGNIKGNIVTASGNISGNDITANGNIKGNIVNATDVNISGYLNGKLNGAIFTGNEFNMDSKPIDFLKKYNWRHIIYSDIYYGKILKTYIVWFDNSASRVYQTFEEYGKLTQRRWSKNDTEWNPWYKDVASVSDVKSLHINGGYEEVPVGEFRLKNGGGKPDTHLNYLNRGENYLSGTTVLRHGDVILEGGTLKFGNTILTENILSKLVKFGNNYDTIKENMLYLAQRGGGGGQNYDGFNRYAGDLAPFFRAIYNVM